MLIIFDCDGVLVDSEGLAAEAMCAVLSEYGVAIAPAEIMRRCVGLSLKDILAIVETIAGVTLPADVSDRIWPATRERFARALQPMPGVADFLRANAVPRCVASSSKPERIRLSLETTGLLGFFGAACFSSAMVARGKPAPDLFLHAASVMQAEPADCLVIEDSPAGVTGAVAAGMRVIGFTGGVHITPAHIERLRDAGAARIVDRWAVMAEAISAVSGYN